MHKPKILHEKENLTIIFLPSYEQELNPAERFFGEMKIAQDLLSQKEQINSRRYSCTAKYHKHY